LELIISPRGQLLLVSVAAPYSRDSADASLANLSSKEIKPLVSAFTAGNGEALLHLGLAWLERPLPPALRWLRDFSESFIYAFCQQASRAGKRKVPTVALPDEDALVRRLQSLPMIAGAENVDSTMLRQWWVAMDVALRKQGGPSPLVWLEQVQPVWRGAGRVHLHLAENKGDKTHPFAFLATYVDGVSSKGGARHIALANAIEHQSQSRDKERLLSLLVPLERAAKRLPWLRQLIDSGHLYQPLRWTPSQALEFLSALPVLQDCGIAAFSPEWWRGSRTSRPSINLKVGSRQSEGVGFDAMLDVQLDITVDGKRVAIDDLRGALAGLDAPAGLVRMKGRWVELDEQRLSSVLSQWDRAQSLASEGLAFADAMRLLAGMSEGDRSTSSAELPTGASSESWLQFSTGPWLRKTLEKLERPELIKGAKVPGLKAELRPYQQQGVDWLRFMSALRLGVCLADDMGLGKTVQVLALLLADKRQSQRAYQGKKTGKKTIRKTAKTTKQVPSLLVLPASLIANWQQEARRFAPTLDVLVLHRSEPSVDLKDQTALLKLIQGVDLVITSYAMVGRLEILASIHWRFLILDEAQAIRNPASGQSKAVKKLNADCRLALSGTPVENSLSDLWSIFDFINPGLLGSLKSFKGYIKHLDSDDDNFRARYAPLRKLVAPYILRRLKTDKKVIADLPDKTELIRYCGLSRSQVKLYRNSVRSLKRELAEVDGMKRRGLVLAYLMRFKQICNHPQHWLGLGEYKPADSGKFTQLHAIADSLASRQERVLVFTQFREMTQPLADFLESIFGRPGIILHGGTAIKRRQKLVDEFQQADGPPFMVLSLKAGGVGLNLTAASHVIHFDRWWNPAVENQATDRAFRIGQQHNVFVHKFVCRGTIEEKIDALITEKVALAGAIVDVDANVSFTEMSDKELLDWVAIDIDRAAAEATT